MIQVIEHSDGTQTNVVLSGSRFDHYDIDKDVHTMRFQRINGWSILEHLVPIIVFFRPYCIVEIGAGASTIYLARIAEQYGVKLYSCDKSPRKNKVYHKNHIFIQKFSEDFMKEFDDTPSVVLIDGDHRYDTAKKEFDFFFDKLVPGGVIFLHDTMPPKEEFLTDTACSDVYKLRQELEGRPEKMDVFTWPYTAGYMGLTMVMKKEENRPYWEL